MSKQRKDHVYHVHFEELAVHADTEALANNLSRKDEVLEDAVVHSRERARAENSRSVKQEDFQAIGSYRGRGWLCGRSREGLRTMRRWATITTCLPENFFSSSRMRREPILWKALSWGTGTKMITARLPKPTSTCKAID